MKTERGKLGDYMQYLKERHGYTSLMKYMIEQFPALGGQNTNQGGFGNIVETEEGTEEDEYVLSKQCTISDLNVLKQQLIEAEAKIRVEQGLARTAARKLEHVEKVTSQRIVETMPGANFEEDTNHLAMLLATVLEKDDFEYNIETDKVDTILPS